MNFKLLGAVIGSLFIFSSCQKEAPDDRPTVYKELPMPTLGSKPKAVVEIKPASETESELDKGKRLYVSNCLQCHNKDPNVKGSIGPEIVDAPLEVMTSKVMTSKYPENLPAGFVPKRKTRAMRAIPKLKDDIPAIWAYVQSVKKKK